MEALRRLLIALFIIAAITAWFAPANTLYLIERVNFKYELEHHPYPWKHKGKSISQYIEEVTRNKTYSVSVEQWQKVAAGIESSASGFTKSNSQTILQFIPCFSLQMSKIYLKAGEDFISIRRLFPRDYNFKQAPDNYKTPYYLWSPFLLLIGSLFYIFLPRYHFSDDTLHYGTGFSAVIGPDIVGLFFIGGFLISLLNWRALLGPTFLNASRNDPLLEVHLKDGSVWSYDLIGAQNVKNVLLCLQNNKVDVDPQLVKIIS